MANRVEATHIAREPRGIEQNREQAQADANSARFWNNFQQVGTRVAQVGLTGLQIAGGTGGLGAGTLGGALGTLGGVDGLLGGTDTMGQLELLNLQRQINMEAQIFTTMTNVEKSHHDARMSAIRNIRP